MRPELQEHRECSKVNAGHMLKMEILTILPCNTMAVSESWKIMPSQVLCGGRQVTMHIQLQCLCHILSTKIPPSG